MEKVRELPDGRFQMVVLSFSIVTSIIFLITFFSQVAFAQSPFVPQQPSSPSSATPPLTTPSGASLSSSSTTSESGSKEEANLQKQSTTLTQTYNDSKYGFKIQYPGGWNIERTKPPLLPGMSSEPLPPNEININAPSNNPNSILGKTTFSISIENVSTTLNPNTLRLESLPPEHYANQEILAITEIFKTPPTIVKNTAITFSGQPAWRLDYIGNSHGLQLSYHSVIFVVKNNKLYTLSLSTTPAKAPEMAPIADKMFQSFKFSGSSSSSSSNISSSFPSQNQQQSQQSQKHLESTLSKINGLFGGSSSSNNSSKVANNKNNKNNNLTTTATSDNITGQRKSSQVAMHNFTSSVSSSHSTPSAESTTNYVNYKDPQGRFSIDYPSGWHVNSATNRFETKLADFFSVYNSESNATDVNIGIERNDPSIMGSGLEQALNVLMNTGDKQIFEPVECSKYTLDGNQACSVIYLKPSAFSIDQRNPFLQIISAMGDNIYVFIYSTSKDNFDKSLPIAEHMIKSFKFGPQASSGANKTTIQNAPNPGPTQTISPSSGGNMTSQPTFGSGLRNVLKQIPSTAADYPNKDPSSVKFVDVKALKGGGFNYVYITGTLLSLSNKTLWFPAPIVYLFDKNSQLVGEVTNGLFLSTELPPHTSGKFNVDIDPTMLKAEPTSYELRFTGTFQ